jgi:hypothetical protein
MSCRVAAVTLIIAGAIGTSGHAQGDPLGQAGWLAGCWEAGAGNRVTLEMWMPPAGGLMIGGSRTVAGGVARAFEHLRLRAVDGGLVYTAIPSGQQETAFTSVVVSDTLLVFENLEHDFPQRIIYRQAGADSVVARVEGPGRDGATRGFDIRFGRARCTP